MWLAITFWTIIATAVQVDELDKGWKGWKNNVPSGHLDQALLLHY